MADYDDPASERKKNPELRALYSIYDSRLRQMENRMDELMTGEALRFSELEKNISDMRLSIHRKLDTNEIDIKQIQQHQKEIAPSINMIKILAGVIAALIAMASVIPVFDRLFDLFKSMR